MREALALIEAVGGEVRPTDHGDLVFRLPQRLSTVAAAEADARRPLYEAMLVLDHTRELVHDYLSAGKPLPDRYVAFGGGLVE